MRPTGPARESVLRTSLRALRRRKKVIAFAALLFLGAGLAYSFFRTPIYAATSELLLQGSDPESLSPDPGEIAPRAAATEVLIVRSRPVRRAVEQRLGSPPQVSVRQVGDTDVIRIRAEDSEAAGAVRVADVYATTYVEMREKQLVDELTRAKNDLQAKVAELDRQLGPLPPGPERDRLSTDRNRLRDSADQLERDVALSDSYVRVLSRASVPESPASPQVVRDALLALGAGLLVGLLLAALLESLDDSIKTKGRLERALRDVPVIAVIPTVDTGSSPRHQLVAVRQPDSPAAEGYRKLRTSLEAMAQEQPMQTLQVTSPGPMQGKTTTAANLGIVIAQTGLRVVVVCCDLRQPRLHELFGLLNGTGLTSVLSGAIPLSAAVRQVSEQPRLSVLSSGPLPDDPSELLASQRMVEVLTSLQAAYDVVLLDTPPVLPVADAMVLSRRVDTTLLVCVAGVTTMRESARAAEALRQVDAPLIGAILHGTVAQASDVDEGTYAREPSITDQQLAEWGRAGQ